MLYLIIGILFSSMLSILLRISEKYVKGDTATLAAVLSDLRSKDIRCIFTEVGASPKILEVIAEQLGIPTAPLVLDGVFPGKQSYEAIFMHNVKTISKHLK